MLGTTMPNIASRAIRKYSNILIMMTSTMQMSSNYPEHIYEALHNVRVAPNLYVVYDRSQKAIIHLNKSVLQHVHSMAVVAEKLESGEWEVQPVVNVRSIKRPHAAFHDFLDAYIKRETTELFRADVFWNEWRQHPNFESVEWRVAIDLLHKRFGNDARCDVDNVIAWRCPPLLPHALKPFVTQVTMKVFRHTTELDLYQVEHLHCKGDPFVVQTPGFTWDHAQEKFVMNRTHPKHSFLLERRDGYYVNPELAGGEEWDPDPSDENSVFAARPTHAETPALVEWMQTHDCWTYLVMAPDKVNCDDLLRRAGLTHLQEFNIEKYREHRLWFSDWWKLQRWQAPTPDAVACLEECLYRGVIRLLLINV